MIPRIQTGSSFKGAELYYLHDKRAEGEAVRETKERVAWTYAINTLENEPEAVLAEMRHTAFDQYLLKMESGNRIDGRPCDKPVMTVSLAWAPEQKPTRNDMIEAGHSFLQHMGWEAHQVLFVAHSDTKHPHVHLIINRVHPETGMTQDAAWAKHRSQNWALRYERENGHIYCAQREARYGREEERGPRGMTQREWKLWQELSKENAVDPDYRRALEAGEWDALKGAQRDERLAFVKETADLSRDLAKSVRETVRFEFATEWKRYAEVREARDKAAALYDREARRAIRELRKQRGTRPVRRSATTEIAVVKSPEGRTYIKRRSLESDGIEQIKERQRAYHQRHREELFALRKDIFDRQKARYTEMADAAMKALWKDRKGAYEGLLTEHRSEKAELRTDQRQGERRYDVLGSNAAAPKPVALTKEQTDEYLRHALRQTARDQDFETAGKEVARADRAREAGQDPHANQPRPEAHQRAKEKTDKDRAQEGKRQSDVDYYLAKRAADRARDRDGGRDR